MGNSDDGLIDGVVGIDVGNAVDGDGAAVVGANDGANVGTSEGANV